MNDYYSECRTLGKNHELYRSLVISRRFTGVMGRDRLENNCNEMRHSEMIVTDASDSRKGMNLHCEIRACSSYAYVLCWFWLFF